MKTSFFALFLLLLSIGNGCCQIIDQEYLVNFSAESDATNINFASPIGQSFTPILTSLNFVNLRLIDSNSATTGATYEVNIYSGVGMNGLLLGTSSAVFLPNDFGTTEMTPNGTPEGGVVDFSFSTPISLTPFGTYTLQIQPLSGENFFLIGDHSSGSTYAGGQAILGGSTALGDVWFQEGIAIPEPSATAILLGGLGLLAGQLLFRARKIIF